MRRVRSWLDKKVGVEGLFGQAKGAAKQQHIIHRMISPADEQGEKCHASSA
jgi:hypothetical protein